MATSRPACSSPPPTAGPKTRGPQRFHLGQHRCLAPAGRLEIDSTGPLVLTQDGRIAKLLIGQHSPVEKEYLVRVRHLHPGPLPPKAMRALQHGLELDGQPQRRRAHWQRQQRRPLVPKLGNLPRTTVNAGDFTGQSTATKAKRAGGHAAQATSGPGARLRAHGNEGCEPTPRRLGPQTRAPPLLPIRSPIRPMWPIVGASASSRQSRPLPASHADLTFPIQRPPRRFNPTRFI